MRQLHFAISRLEYSGPIGKALVVGRNCRDIMKVGDRVTAMVRMGDDFDNANRVIATEPVALTMPVFHVFDREMDTLGPGYVGGIYLDTSVATGLRLGWYLVGENG